MLSLQCCIHTWKYIGTFHHIFWNMPQNLQPNFAHTTTLELLLRPSPMLLHQIERKTTRFWGRDVICHFAATKSCSCNARIMATAISSRKVTGLERALSVPVLRQNVARFVTGITAANTSNAVSSNREKWLVWWGQYLSLRCHKRLQRHY